MKIDFKKECVFLGASEKVSKKGNKYNIASVLIDGQAQSLYCSENVVLDVLNFGDKIEVSLSAVIGEKYDKLEVIGIFA